jgi:hypothetical protein
MQKTIESLEKEKINLREKVGELDMESKQLTLNVKERDDKIK